MTETKDLSQTVEARKPYLTPAIIHELELETRAGSPLGIPDPLDENFPVP
ncbi:MAG: hypothetical protein JW908_10250 [Anaerolineales bacterium]|nr:hypothetical protein [Anaerolineales bacterium]